jgi:preprotein translocase subunit SecG
VTLYLDLALILISIALIALILLQSRGAGLGGLGGGGGDFGGAGYHARRGIERLLFNITIVLSIAFFTLAILAVGVTV